MNADSSSTPGTLPTTTPPAALPATPAVPVAAASAPSAAASPNTPPQKPTQLFDPENTLVRLLSSGWKSLKRGELGNPKLLAGILLVLLAGGLTWYFLSQSSKASSARWAAIVRADNPAEWERLSKENADNFVGKLARLEKARKQLGPDGIARLTSERKKSDRLKAVGSIEAAREEFLKLADEFKKDPSQRSQCYIRAADAELALVGWPREGTPMPTDDPTKFRGTVAKAVEYLNKAAEAIGPKTAAGEALTKRAAELDAESKKVLTVQRELFEYLAIWEPVEEPKPVPDNLKAPGASTTDPAAPKGPDKPLDPKDPKEPASKGDPMLPKGPDKPLDPKDPKEPASKGDPMLPKGPDKPLDPKEPAPMPQGPIEVPQSPVPVPKPPKM